MASTSIGQATAEPAPFDQQTGVGGISQRVLSGQGGRYLGSSMPAPIGRPWYPPVYTQPASGGQTAFTIQGSSPWDCSLTFPAGVLITNVVSGLPTYSSLS